MITTKQCIFIQLQKKAFHEMIQEQRAECDSAGASLQRKVLEVSWRDNDNTTDCGVYLLKHMETYRGQPAEEWEIGLKVGDVSYCFNPTVILDHNR